MRTSHKLGLGIGTILMLSGCTNPEFNVFGPGANRVDWAGARQVVSSEGEYFTAGRLADMVDAATASTPGARTESVPPPPQVPATETEEQAVRRLDEAFARFARTTYQAGETQDRASLLRAQYRMRDARNTIQDQLIAASNNRCNVYKAHLTRFTTGTQFGLGAAATALGGAGALLSGGATQAASALSGIFSGLNAEFQKDFMANVMTNVIIPGIDRQRSDLRNDIVRNSCRSIAEYPLPLAIAEVVRYHGACNINVGIAASGQAVTRTQPDSLEAVLAAVRKAGDINKALANAAAPKQATAGTTTGTNAETIQTRADTTPQDPAPKTTTDLLGSNLDLPNCPPLTPSGRQLTPAVMQGRPG